MSETVATESATQTVNPPATVIGNAEPADSPAQRPDRELSTPILGLLPLHSEAEIEARYLGYVQHVRQEADENILKLQKKASEPISKADAEKKAALAEARKQHKARVDEIEHKHREILKAAKANRQRKLDKAQNALDKALESAGEAFSAVAGPAAETLKIQLRAVSNDIANKLELAGKEFTPAFSAAQAKRIKAQAEEKARKEAEAAMKAQIEVANENQEEKILEAPAV